MPRPRCFAPVLVLLLAACAQGNTGLGSGSGSEGGSAPTGCEPGTSAPCYTGPEGTEGLGICRAGSAVCREDGVSYGDCESQVLPAIEDCASGLDEDCDGDILDADAGCVCAPNTANLCYDGPAGTKDVGLCVGGTSVCGADGKGFAPCAGQIVPAVEDCTQAGDEDCDGQEFDPEDGCVCVPGDVMSCYSGAAGTDGVGACVAGTSSCAADGKSWDPCFGEIVPTQELCATGIDDDCDGALNEEGPDCTCVPGTTASCYTGPGGTQGVGACGPGTWTCNVLGTGYGGCMGQVLPATETCNTPFDDDCDGQVNESGPGCVCTPNASVACYSGPAGSQGLGVCVGGTALCNALGTALGACVGQVLPGVESCANQLDDDCDGTACGGPLWSVVAGDGADQRANALAHDSTDNVLLAGSFGGTIDLGAGPLSSAGQNDVLLGKLNAAGAILWAKSFGDASDQLAAAVASDPQDSVLAAGSFAGTVGFGGAALVSAGSTDVFVTKLNSAGVHSYSRRFGDVVAQSATGLAVDTSGSALVCGRFAGTLAFGGSPLTSAGGDDAFILKLNAFGNFSWAKRYGDATTQSAEGVAVDSANNVLVVGTFQGTVDFGTGPVTSAGGTDIFVLKLDSAGNFVWLRTYGDAADQSVSDVATDSTNAVVFGGSFAGSVNFGGATHTATGVDLYLAKLDSAGTFVWSLQDGAAGSELVDDVDVDASGNVAATGHFDGAVSFGLGTTPATSPSDLFLVKVSSLGAPQWLRTYANGLAQAGSGVAFDATGNVVVAGFTTGTVNFGLGPHVGAGGADVAVAKLAP
jgi:hypothetical protein